MRQRVVHEVVKKTSEQHGIALELDPGVARNIQRDMGVLSRVAPSVEQLFHDVVHGQRFASYVEGFGVAPGQQQQSIREHGQPGRLVANLLETSRRTGRVLAGAEA